MGDIKFDVQAYLESQETYPPKGLVERFLVQVKEDVEEAISDNIARELINLILTQRRNKLRKNQIWRSVRLLSQEPFLWQWKYSEPRKFFTPQLRNVFEAIFSYLPSLSKRPRKRREYPLQEIRALKKKGLSVRKIAKEVGVPKSTIHRLLKVREKE